MDCNWKAGLAKRLSLSSSFVRSCVWRKYIRTLKDRLPGRLGRILILAPHMDDEVIGCGGLIWSFSREGCEVAVAYLTDGAYGRTGIERQTRRNLRAGESRAACSILGVRRQYFLDQPDGALACSPDLILRLRKIILEEEPEAIWVPYPWDSHPDHRQAFLILCKVLECGNTPAAVFGYQLRVSLPLERIEWVLDLSAVWDLKCSALEAFESQSRFVLELTCHLQECQRYLKGGRAKAVEPFCRLDRADAAVFEGRHASFGSLPVSRFIHTGWKAIRRASVQESCFQKSVRL